MNNYTVLMYCNVFNAFIYRKLKGRRIMEWKSCIVLLLL